MALDQRQLGLATIDGTTLGAADQLPDHDAQLARELIYAHSNTQLTDSQQLRGNLQFVNSLIADQNLLQNDFMPSNLIRAKDPNGGDSRGSNAYVTGSLGDLSQRSAQNQKMQWQQ